MSKLSKMSFIDLVLYVEEKYSEFNRMSHYLNESGKAALDTYSLLSDLMQFTSNKEELIKDINNVITHYDENNAIIKNLKGFIKQIG